MPDPFEFGEMEPQVGEAVDFGEPEVQDITEFEVAEESTIAAPAPTKELAETPKGGALANGFDFNSIDLGLTGAGVMVAETGTKVSRFPIERIKFTTSKKERISIILDRVVIVKTHFIEDTGSIICNGSYCCEVCGLPAVRYVFPVVHYENTDKKGSPLSADIDVKVLAIGKDNYEELLTIMDNKGPLSQFDLVVTCNDEGYQKCSFTEAGDAKWKKSRKAQEFVAERLKKDGKNLVACLGRTVTDAQLKKLLGEDAAPTVGEDVDMDSIFNDE